MKNLAERLLLKTLTPTLCSAVVGLLVAGCGGGGGGGEGRTGASTTVIQNRGSDTMVNLAQSWAETYAEVAPEVSVEVSGGGSGVGIAALINGTVDIANASRDMKASEMEQAKQATGKDPKEFTVGFDALAIFVHKDNPMEEITFDQLANIYAEDGTITLWSQLGVTVPGGQDEIIRVSRQSSSGTYEFLREHVLKKKDYKLGSRDMNGSKEVVELVGNTPSAIGYSGMGYATHEVKMLKVSLKEGEPGFTPSVENTISKDYPIARSLHMYTLGEPTGATKAYIDWVLSPPGQAIVEQTGYVPVITTSQ